MPDSWGVAAVRLNLLRVGSGAVPASARDERVVPLPIASKFLFDIFVPGVNCVI